MDIRTADRLVRLRKKNGYSQEQLAEKLGLSRQAVSKWERGEASPDTDNLIALARLYGISLDELVLKEDGNQESNGSAVKEETGNQKRKRNPVFDIISASSGLLLLALYLILGAVLERGFEIYWVLLLLIPVVPSIFDAIGKRKFTAFLFPLPVTALYCYLGMAFGLWHPYWVLFIAIPVYYLCFEPIDRYLGREKKDGQN